uniref:G domain-containing protein n=1 Tax=Erythrolobus australicus TaxID=1077150 RepID=A0A7S1TM16_9RHOD
MWAHYFAQNNIEAYFFSALNEAPSTSAAAAPALQEETRSCTSGNDDSGSGSSHSEGAGDSDSESNHADANCSTRAQGDDEHVASEAVHLSEANEGSDAIGMQGLLDVEKLLEIFRGMAPEAKQQQKRRLRESASEDDGVHAQNPMASRCVVGMVGYPNVGKSSTINAIMGHKRVAVSATPGKTKHFQTFVLDDELVICDCPGLVFPNFSSSRAELLCNGILPIDHLREPIAPVELLVQRIPPHALEKAYSLKLSADSAHIDPNTFALSGEQHRNPRELAIQLLVAYASARGYMSDHGRADIQRAARILLKDYVTGRRVWYCHAPPGAVGRHGAVFARADGSGEPEPSTSISSQRVPPDDAELEDDGMEMLFNRNGVSKQSVGSGRSIGRAGANLQSRGTHAGSRGAKLRSKKAFESGVVVRGRQQAAAFTGARVERPFKAK